MRKQLLLVAALTLLLPAFAQAKKKSEPAKINVMSYNIRVATADDGTNSWPYRCFAAATMLNDQHPDVFGVQEALPVQMDLITTNFDGRQGRIGYKCVGVGRDDGKHSGEHMAIFYDKKNIKLIRWGTYWLSETPETPSFGWDAKCRRTATWALMQDKRSGKKFFFVNTHLDHKGIEARKKGLALIVERIASMNPDGYPMVLTGDFNVKPDNECLVELNKVMKSARDFADKTDSQPSFNGWGKKQSVIDYIYYSGFTNCSEFMTVTKPYLERKFVSDHNPIRATLVF